MAKTKGFLEYKRQEVGHRSVQERIHDYLEMDLPLSPEQLPLWAK